MSTAILKDQIELGECVSCIDFSPSGDCVAVGLIDESVRVWKADFSHDISKQELFKFDGHMMGVVDVKFNPSGNRIAVSSLDSMIRVWNVDDGEKICEIQCNPSEIRDQSTLITAGEQGKVSEYNINSKQLIGTIPTRDIFATALATVMMEGQCVGKEKSCFLLIRERVQFWGDKWRADFAEEFSHPPLNKYKLVGVGNNDGSVFIIDYQNGKHVTQALNFHNKLVRSLSFSNDGMRLLTASDDGSAKLVDLIKQQAIFTFTGHLGNVNCVDYCPIDEKLFVTCSSDKTLKVWDINKKSCIEVIKFHQDNVWAAKFHPTRPIIGSVSDDGVVAFHELK